MSHLKVNGMEFLDREALQVTGMACLDLDLDLIGMEFLDREASGMVMSPLKVNGGGFLDREASGMAMNRLTVNGGGFLDRDLDIDLTTAQKCKRRLLKLLLAS